MPGHSAFVADSITTSLFSLSSAVNTSVSSSASASDSDASPSRAARLRILQAARDARKLSSSDDGHHADERDVAIPLAPRSHRSSAQPVEHPHPPEAASQHHLQPSLPAPVRHQASSARVDSICLRIAQLFSTGAYVPAHPYAVSGSQSHEWSYSSMVELALTGAGLDVRFLHARFVDDTAGLQTSAATSSSVQPPPPPPPPLPPSSSSSSSS